jgi:glycosyltransferase involved in cell wall biosynthesis
LSAALNSIGVKTTLLTTILSEEPWIDGIEKFINGRSLSSYGVWLSIGYKRRVRKAIINEAPDLIHIHGIWNWRMHVIASVARELGVPYVISPRGALSKWALSQSKFKKFFAWHIFQKEDIAKASAIIVTSQGEKTDIERLGVARKIELVPNGVNLPNSLPVVNKASDRTKQMLFLSRIHKVKGLEDLVRAWISIDHSGWELKIFGNDGCDYWQQIEQEIDNLGNDGSIHYEGAISDSDKWLVYANSDCFVLPSYSENFGIVVAEALYAGIPAITTESIPWGSLPNVGAGWSVPNGVKGIANALKEAIGLSDVELKEMGKKGNKYVIEKFGWNSIAKKMLLIYEQCK